MENGNASEDVYDSAGIYASAADMRGSDKAGAGDDMYSNPMDATRGSGKSDLYSSPMDARGSGKGEGMYSTPADLRTGDGAKQDDEYYVPQGSLGGEDDDVYLAPQDNENVDGESVYDAVPQDGL